MFIKDLAAIIEFDFLMYVDIKLISYGEVFIWPAKVQIALDFFLPQRILHMHSKWQTGEWPQATSEWHVELKRTCDVAKHWYDQDNQTWQRIEWYIHKTMEYHMVRELIDFRTWSQVESTNSFLHAPCDSSNNFFCPLALLSMPFAMSLWHNSPAATHVLAVIGIGTTTTTTS